MEIEVWAQLSDTNRMLIQIAAGLAALSAIIAWGGGFYRGLSSKMRAFNWVFSEQHEHETIKKQLDEISFKLEKNGGSHIPDALERIEKELSFIGARDRVQQHTQDKPLFETDKTGHVVHVNRAYRKLLAIDGESAKGMGWVNVIDSRDRTRIVDLWFKAVEGQRDFDEYMNLVDANGKSFHAHAVAYVIKANNCLIGHMGEIILLERKDGID
jgi:PAS domain-containing protein